MKNRKSQLGMGLVQVVIAASLMSTLSLVVAGMIVSQSRQISYMEDRMSYMNAKKHIEDLIDLNADACTESVSGVKIPKKGAKVSIAIKDSDKSIVFDARKKNHNKYDRIKIKKLYVEDINAYKSKDGEGEVDIIVETERERKGGGPTTLTPIKIRKKVVIDQKSKKLTDCIDSNNQVDACVVKDVTKRSGKSFGDVGSVSVLGTVTPGTSEYKLPKEVEAVKFYLAGYTTHHNVDNKRSGEDTITCDIPETNLVFYPGVTKVNSKILPDGGLIKVVMKEVGSFSYKSQNSSGKTRVKQKSITERTLYYAGRKLLTQRSRSSERGCTTRTVHYKNLMGNELPPKCGVKNFRGTASTPPNLSFEIYKTKD